VSVHSTRCAREALQTCTVRRGGEGQKEHAHRGTRTNRATSQRVLLGSLYMRSTIIKKRRWGCGREYRGGGVVAHRVGVANIGAVPGWAFAGPTTASRRELTNTTPNAHTLPTTSTHHQKYTEIPPEPAGAGNATPHAAIGSPTFLGLGGTRVATAGGGTPRFTPSSNLIKDSKHMWVLGPGVPSEYPRVAGNLLRGFSSKLAC
jgi:hypothetical protein